MRYSDFAQHNRLGRERRIAGGGGRLRVFVGPARSSKTGFLWLEWFAMRGDKDDPRRQQQAFHFARTGDDREAKLGVLMGRLASKLRERKQSRQHGKASDTESLLWEDIELLISFYERRTQSITNAPLDGSQGIEKPSDITRALRQDTDVVFIDDAHLLGAGLTELCCTLANEGRDVLVAAWKLDPSGESYPEIGRLMCEAEEVTVCRTHCAHHGCPGDDPPATYTQRVYDGVPVGALFVPPGGSAARGIGQPSSDDSGTDGRELDLFCPVCRQHFEEPHSDAPGQLSLSDGHASVPRASLTVISGPMFSGKTRELLLRVEQEAHLGGTLAVYKALARDESDSAGEPVVRTHTAKRVSGYLSLDAQPVRDNAELIAQCGTEDATVVIIDRAQFLPGLGEACRRLLRAGKRVIVSGIDQTFAGAPFGEMPEVLCLADWIVKLHGVCKECGSGWGSKTQRFVDGDRRQAALRSAPEILVAHEEAYEVRCRHCHTVLE